MVQPSFDLFLPLEFFCDHCCIAGNTVSEYLTSTTVPQEVEVAVKDAISGKVTTWEHVIEAVLKKGVCFCQVGLPRKAQ